ncbi:hypothetical protein evm_013247 [Chilo suppressalis]|nr:hypothetical protein evm_013247 [Chilo suppressalis]
MIVLKKKMPCNCKVALNGFPHPRNGCGLRVCLENTEPKGHHQHQPHRKTFDDDDEVQHQEECCDAADDPVRYPDGSVRLRNPNIELMDQDILYHLALGSGSHDLVEMFGDVKFVCMGGTPKRMEQFAYTIMAEIGHKLPCGTTLQDISHFSYRYSMYKVGPVLSISVYGLDNQRDHDRRRDRPFQLRLINNGISRYTMLPVADRDMNGH